MKILVIGGGASGLYFAIKAARNGLDVSLIEHKDELGKKILSTGNGRCNYTNKLQNIEAYYGNEKAFNIIKKYSSDKSIEFFRSLGVESLDRENYIYPYSEQASQIRQVLVSELENLNVKLYLSSKIEKIEYKNQAYNIFLNSLKYLKFDKIIFATGSKAFPVSGSDGSSLKLLKDLGVKYRDFAPALCPVYCMEKNFFKLAAGVRTMAKASLFVDEKFILSDYGQIQITDYGLSGIPIFQLSPKIASNIQKEKELSISIDFLPHISDKISFLENRLSLKHIEQAKHLLLGVLNDKLAQALLKRSGIRENKALKELTKKDIEVLAKIISFSKFVPFKMADFNKAQVCSGGVSLDSLSENLEYGKGLFFIGELVDVDAKCGGYNLQWAFSSANLVADFLKK